MDTVSDQYQRPVSLKRVLPPLFIGFAFVAVIMPMSKLLAGIMFTLIVITATWQVPAIGLVLVVAAVPFQQDLALTSAVKFSLAEVNLALAAFVMFMKLVSGGHPIRLSSLQIPVLIYILVCLVSGLVNWRGGVAITSLVQMFMFLTVSVTVFASLVDRVEEFKPALNTFIVIGVCLGLLQIITRDPYVLGLHKNGAGATLASAFVVATEFWFSETDSGKRRRLLVALALIGVGMFFYLSRGAWMAAFVGVLTIAALRHQWQLLSRFAIYSIPIVIACWFLLGEEQKSYVFGFETERWNVKHRLNNAEFAWDHFQKNVLLGDGVGLRKQHDATNVILFTLAETGVLGLIAFSAIHIVFLRQLWVTQKVLDRTDPLYSPVAIAGALVLGRLTHGMVDHYWSRGVLTLAWGAAGMATLAYLQVRARNREAKQAEATLANMM